MNTPEGLAAAAVSVVPGHVELASPGADTVHPGPFANPAVALRAFVAAG